MAGIFINYRRFPAPVANAPTAPAPSAPAAQAAPAVGPIPAATMAEAERARTEWTQIGPQDNQVALAKTSRNSSVAEAITTAAEIRLRCKGRLAVVTVLLHSPSYALGDVPVAYRVGNNVPVRETWNATGPNKTLLVAPNGAALLRQLAAATYFSIRVFPDSDATLESFVFDLSGLDQRIGAIKGACDW